MYNLEFHLSLIKGVSTNHYLHFVMRMLKFKEVKNLAYIM